MIETLNLVFQLAMLAGFVVMGWAIFQVIDVIREERERLSWYRRELEPVRNDDDNRPDPIS